ncbi:hypothetical protein FRX31_002657 [Thalictrum thalictroides]|uniref:Uncharacterized protein n=1 Tax=Thalictrum thalictroides TaxID=46969 RepID=A0A7J6XD76_THATH|nr:hypothetical protein FRX31_002657 [Thalictrum thalictroides]
MEVGKLGGMLLMEGRNATDGRNATGGKASFEHEEQYWRQRRSFESRGCIRLIAEAGEAADLELKAVKDSLESCKQRTVIAEHNERDLQKKLQAKDREIEQLTQILEQEKKDHKATYEAWKAKWDELMTIGTPEEEGMPAMDELNAGTSKDPLVGPELADKDPMLAD